MPSDDCIRYIRMTIYVTSVICLQKTAYICYVLHNNYALETSACIGRLVTQMVTIML